MRPRIALVTCADLPSLYDDEQALLGRLEAAGADATAVVWSDARVRWSDFDRVVLRSTWDYYRRLADFEAWLARMERDRVPLFNPASLVRWNLDKRYLAALAARGVRIAPTRFIEPGEPVDLAGLVAEARWPEAILKPAVSAAGYRTFRFAAADAARLQPELDAITGAGAALVQPFLPEIVGEGEWSLLFFGGELSHAVVKRPAAGDFRVQHDYGGTFRAAEPAPRVAAAATAILGELPIAPLYARIDGIVREGDFVLMEVEVIEPYLFLPGSRDGAERYVRALTSFG